MALFEDEAMKKIYLPGLALGAFLSLAAGNAAAQYSPYQYPTARPAYSPWLGLLRPGATPLQNYEQLVRPQFDFGGGIYSLQGQTLANRGAISSLEGGLAAQFATGHRSGFMTQSRYFLNNGTGAPGGASSAGGATRAYAGPTTSSSSGGSSGAGYGGLSRPR
jgi:hypothetical protein